MQIYNMQRLGLSVRLVHIYFIQNSQGTLCNHLHVRDVRYLVSLCSTSCGRRRWRQTGDITSCWGQSSRNRPAASWSAVIAITTLTQPRTHTCANIHNNTIVSSKLSVRLVYWHNFEALCIFVCLCDMSLSWSHFLYAFLGTSYLVCFIVVCVCVRI